MSQTINILNYASHNILQQSELAQDYAAGVTSLVLKNVANFAARPVALGTLGGENTELRIISAVTAATDTITLSAATLQPHGENERATLLFGDKIRIYHAANVNGTPPDDDSFALLDTIDLQADRNHSEYIDPDGSSEWWYKSTYYNSAADTETNLSDSTAVRGGGIGNYASIAAIRKEAGFEHAPYVTDQEIDEKRQAAQVKINGMLTGVYAVPFTSPINPFIADITVRLAAGYLLLKQYSAYRSQMTVNGQTKVDEALADLKALATKQTVLTDHEGNDISQDGSMGGVTAWPNATTADASRDVGGAPRVFRMADIQGYGSRKY